MGVAISSISHFSYLITLFFILSYILPTGDVYNEITSGKALVQYILDNDIFSVYDLTYSQFQEILGIYNGD